MSATPPTAASAAPAPAMTPIPASVQLNPWSTRTTIGVVRAGGSSAAAAGAVPREQATIVIAPTAGSEVLLMPSNLHRGG